MKRVYIAANLPDAHILAHQLEELGIACHIFNENMQGGLGELPFTHVWPEVWIEDERDENRALELIRAFERPAAEGSSWTCPRCLEENPHNFAVCWRCGHEAAPR